jgi:RNA polymerase sigma-70 factor, ECF subfamily
VSDLVTRATRGDRNAFAALYRDYAKMVHGVGLSRLGPSEADDLVQDVFLSALERLDSLRGAETFGGWLLQIARNRAIDLLRGRRPTAQLSEDAEPARDHNPETVSDAERILRKIQVLPEAYRETLVLRLVEGMTGNEIAERVGLTPESVRVNLHRGMQLLTEAL